MLRLIDPIIDWEMNEVKIEIEKPSQDAKEEKKETEMKEMPLNSPTPPKGQEPDAKLVKKEEKNKDEDLPLIDQKTKILTIIFTIIRVIVMVSINIFI